MSAILSDEDIASLTKENKTIPADYRRRIELRLKRGHKERELDVQGANGNEFRIILRQSLFNPLDFSVILTYMPPMSNQLFRLRRYNGKSHEHTNPIEGETFYGFHIHQATERYQQMGAKEDMYAEPTNRFSDFHQAISCMLRDCSFDIPSEPLQMKLFEEI